MGIKNRKTVGVLALSALLAGSAGLVGCGTSSVSGTATGSGSATDTSTDTATNTDATTDTTSDSTSNSYEVECRRGIVNDPYPGICHDYVDADGNGICDLSEPSDTVSSQATAVALSTADDDSSTSTSGGCPLAPCSICGICANLS